MTHPPPPTMTGAVADRPRDLLVSGHVNIDRFLSVRSFPEADRTVPVLTHRAELGGTATNIVRVATKLGVATGLVARVGDGFPEEYLAAVRDAGVDLRGVEHVRGIPTPTCYIIEDGDGAQRTLIDQGAMTHSRGARLPTGWLREYSWLHLTTADPEFQLRLQKAARSRGLHVAADPAQEIHYRWDRRSFRELLRGSEILFGNRAEIARALEFVGARRAEGLLEFVPLVIRTEGRNGASAFSRAGRFHVTAAPHARVRTLVGAGDAFRGGFYAAWFAGQPLVRCLAAGTRSSARWIEGKR
ncbi:MAG: PfkB family carbohydrate kinase [Thermoplasmata archaeon]|jgi:sugar/nucleoside kinase (ribokinase family)